MRASNLLSVISDEDELHDRSDVRVVAGTNHSPQITATAHVYF
jgi:hypothetical protein